jgi:5-(carboxyamino)imidazole ribonucleotide mutase
MTTDKNNPLVLIMMGSASDYDIMQESANVRNWFKINHDMIITSAHKTPSETINYIKEYESKGVEVFICGAGMAAHLAGVVAAYTLLPVIGVPLPSTASSLGGIDALLSTVQMPAGIPVATTAIGKPGAKNAAAILAVQIIAKKHIHLQEKLQQYRQELRDSVLQKNIS